MCVCGGGGRGGGEEAFDSFVVHVIQQMPTTMLNNTSAFQQSPHANYITNGATGCNRYTSNNALTTLTSFMVQVALA